ncbi:hypothetical protein [Primorskyibacter sp. S187A]|uniref:hypothetical protein n=1 Tax=Primorskyibacter sp. S187A TaxID=3415130 RepID=UPI003C7A635D
MRRLFLRLSALIALPLMLLACAPPTQTDAGPEFAFAQDAAAMRAQLAGRTAKFDGPGHGTQIEYFAPGGRAFLWYPGNATAVPSLWKTQAGRRSAEICFKYPSRSYNPVTDEFGGRWECRPSAVFGARMTALIEGDEFNLSSGQLPKRLPRGAILTLQQVEQVIGRSLRGNVVYQR